MCNKTNLEATFPYGVLKSCARESWQRKFVMFARCKNTTLLIDNVKIKNHIVNHAGLIALQLKSA